LTISDKFVNIIKTRMKKENSTMAYVIDNKCISCGACEDSCPVSAISAGDEIYVINADECISCGACCDTCPQEAISEE
jgi:formate hydrogenlyase subunit 6/NADH:ubiquinone oxidoreductase subunit I